MKLKGATPYLLLLLLNIIMCLLLFYPFLGRLNHTMLSGGGDGIKNYLTYLYYIRFDKGTLYTGMNYPFGEHVIFTDNMPAFSWTIGKLRMIFPGIGHYGLLIMHSAFILSYVLSSFYVYKILRIFSVKGWWAIASAIFIAYFSPQFGRLFGHFGLSLNCFFPMLIYWLMQFDRRRKAKYLVYIYCLTSIFMFIHVYHLAFSFVLILAYGFATVVTTRTGMAKKLKKALLPLIPVVAAVGTFKIFLLLTDMVTDRPSQPIGYLGGATTGADILVSSFTPIGRTAFLWMFGEINPWSEGYSYLGLITILCSGFMIYRVIRSIVLRIGKKIKVPTHPVRIYRKWLVAALVVLLFSMGVPFVWGLEFVTDYFSVFRQFRTLGRFTWIFYYLIMIYASILLYRCFLRMEIQNQQKRYIALATVVLCVWLAEWNGYAMEIHKRSEEALPNYDQFYSTGTESWDTWLRKQGYDPKQFQATAGLPYFHIGSEKLGLQNNDYPKTMYVGSQLAMQTGLPMMDVMMSRSSWSQAFEQVRFFDGPFTEKTLATKLNSKPLLLFVNKNYMLSSGESYMLRYGKFIGNRDNVDFYRFDIQAMIKGDKLYTDSCVQLALKDGRKEGLLAPDNRFAYSQHFDNQVSSTAFMGKGEHPADADYHTEILTIPVTHLTDDTLFIFSTWMHCFSNGPQMPHIAFEELNAKGEVMLYNDYLANHSTYITNNWYKAERIVTINKDAVKIRFYAMGGKKEYIALDELLIQPINSIYFYKPNDSVIMINNRPVKTQRQTLP
jgi:hypothetical protein